eukprot:COSAG05_NODE_978_length_6327_cov_7.588150_3_plen_435_part_00
MLVLAAAAAQQVATIAIISSPFTVRRGQNNCYGDPPQCIFRGRFDNYTSCEAVCQFDATCSSFTWVGPGTEVKYSRECRTRTDAVWELSAEGGHVSGFKGALPPPPGVGCKVDEDCSLLGRCGLTKPGVCDCDPGWNGPDCGQLKLLPAVPGSGYNLTGQNPAVSSWGANIFPSSGDPNSMSWVMYVSEFQNSCDISHWSPNSAIVRATSSTGPAGPYSRDQVAVKPFAHNPKVVRSPDGTWLMYTIGVQLPPFDLINCSGPSPIDAVVGAAASPPPGRNPENRESNITLYTSKTLQGPWSRFGVVLGPDFEGTWDEDTSNPSPWVLPNGTVLLMYRGCIVFQPGCHGEYMGVASAPSWKGPYKRLSKSPILPKVYAEDPSMWVDPRGNFHFLMHYIPDGVRVARHAFSRSYTGPWAMHESTIPYRLHIFILYD